MWQDIQDITGCKSRSIPIMCEATLVDKLNSFYARFDLLHNESAVKSTLPPEEWPLLVSTEDLRRILLSVNMRKAAEPDNIPSWVLKTCANQLADVITAIFNISLSKKSVLIWFKTANILSVPKQASVSSPDWQSHLLHSSAKHWNPPRMCDQPPPVYAVAHDCNPPT